MRAFYGERKIKEMKNKMGGDNTRVPRKLADKPCGQTLRTFGLHNGHCGLLGHIELSAS